MLLALYRGTPSIRFPPAAGLWEEVYNLARMLASDRRLTWAAGSMPSKKRSGPSGYSERHCRYLENLQPLPARDVSKKMFRLPRCGILRIVARGTQNRKLDPGATEYKLDRALVFHPKGPGQLRAPEPYQIKRLPARRVVNFSTRSGAPWKTTIGSQEKRIDAPRLTSSMPALPTGSVRHFRRSPRQPAAPRTEP
jgi:hypothetical protein